MAKQQSFVAKYATTSSRGPSKSPEEKLLSFSSLVESFTGTSKQFTGKELIKLLMRTDHLPYKAPERLKELEAEHGIPFVRSMVTLGKALIFSKGHIETTFDPVHFIPIQYALSSMGVTSYTTEHHWVYKNEDIFTFNEIDKKGLEAERKLWQKAASTEVTLTL